MNLHRQIINEGCIPAYALTLNQIINDGQVSNSYQTYVLALLVDFFKDGPADISFLETPQPMTSNATSTVAINAIRVLAAHECVSLARYLLDLLNQKIMPPSMPTATDWMRLVLRKQD